jgi:hypothetical protein
MDVLSRNNIVGNRIVDAEVRQVIELIWRLARSARDVG